MNIRNITIEDINELKKIHELYYKHEFEFPDFLNNYLCNFVITNEFDEIITAGALKPLAEVILVTNKEASISDKYVALSKALEINQYTAQKLGFASIHAFVQNQPWRARLLKSGFKPTKGEALYLGVQ